MIKFKYVLVILVSLLLMTSCSTDVEGAIKGEGKVISITKKVKSFNKIKIDGRFNLFLNQDETEKVRIEAEQNILDVIQIYNDGRTLIVQINDSVHISNSTTIDLFITIENLKLIELSIVGDLKTENSLDLKNLIIENNSVGNIDFSLICKKLTVINNGVGEFNLFGLVNKFTLENNAVGNVEAFGLNAEKVNVTNNGVGNVLVNATESIDVENNGVGNVIYKGNPEKRELENNAVGTISEEK